MQFTPKTEKEVAEAGLLPKGTYDFEIVEAKDKVSKSNNEMIELKVAIYDENGSARFIFDYLLESVAYKLRHAAYACGLGAHYENGVLSAHDFVGKSGQAEVIIQKDKTGQYSDKNSVRDYVVGANGTAHKNGNASADLNDEVPF